MSSIMGLYPEALVARMKAGGIRWWANSMDFYPCRTFCRSLGRNPIPEIK